MRTDRSRKSALASFLLVASLAAACGGGGASGSQSGTPASHGPTPVPTPVALTAFPVGFPTTYVDVHKDPDPGMLPVAGGLQGTYIGTLTAPGGTAAAYTATWVENRVPVASVVCRGSTFTNQFIGETPEVTIEVTFPGWGSAELVTKGQVVVYRSSRNGSSPPICDDTTGGTFHFDFTGGPTHGTMSGTWHFDATGNLVFDAPVPSSAAPSQSPG